MDTYKQVLPYLRNIVPKWNSVKTTDLNADKHVAHKFFIDTMRNSLQSKKLLRTLIFDYEKSLIEDDDDEESDDQASNPHVTPGEPEVEAVCNPTSDTPNPELKQANTAKVESPKSEATKPSKMLVGAKRSFEETTNKAEDEAISKKIRAELDHLSNLHAEMMDKYQIFVGAHDAWEC